MDIGNYGLGIGGYNCDQTIGFSDFADWAAFMTRPHNFPRFPSHLAKSLSRFFHTRRHVAQRPPQCPAEDGWSATTIGMSNPGYCPALEEVIRRSGELPAGLEPESCRKNRFLSGDMAKRKKIHVT